MASSQSSSPPGWRLARKLRPVAATFGDGNGSSGWPDGSSSATDATCDAHGAKWSLDCMACDNYADLHGERLKERARRFARNRSAENPSCWKHSYPVSACVACQVWQHMIQQVNTTNPQRLRPSSPCPNHNLVMSEDLAEASPSKEEYTAEAGKDPPTPKRHASKEATTGSTPASDLSATSNPRAPPFTVWMDNWPGYLITTDDDTAPLHPCNIRCKVCFFYGHPWDVQDPNIACWLPAGHDDEVGVHICRSCWLIQRAEAGLALDEPTQLMELSMRCVTLSNTLSVKDLEILNTPYLSQNGGYG